MSEAGTSGLYALMDRYIDGDPRAFTRLHGILTPRLRAFLIRLVADEAAVDDLVQLTLLKAHLARERFALQGGDPDGAVQAWYFAICRNVAMDHLRNRYRVKNRMHAGEDGDAVAGLPDADPNVEQRGEEAEREAEIVERVRAAIARLPPGQREVVELHKLRGMSMAEIAERLSVREGAVRVRAHRAYRALASMLSRGEVDAVVFWVLLSARSGDAFGPGVAPHDACDRRPASRSPSTAPVPRPDASHTARGSYRRP